MALHTSVEEYTNFMDVDLVDFPDELLEVNDEFIDVYLKNVRDDSSVGRALLPSFDLDDPLLDQPAPLPVGSASTSAGSQIARGDMLQPGHAPAIPPPDPNAQIPAPFFPTMSSGGASGFDVQSYPVGEGEEDEDEDDELGSKGRRGPGGRKVTPQRKKNNRKAQQRYREKRKQQAAEREEQVAVLSSQLAAMQTIQNEHAVVSSENVQLREVLLQKEAEIENLKKTMADKTSQNMDEGNTHANSVNKDLDSEDDDNEPEEMNPAVPHGLDRAVQVQSTHKAATNKLKILVQEMTALMQAHGLPTISYTGGHELFGKDGVTCKLRTKVIEANKISVRRLLSAPTCPVERSSHCSKRFSMVHPCSIFRTHWIGIIDRLHIDDSQTEALLTARTAALEQLRVIYEERSALNQMTMAIMLPSPSPQAMYSGTTNHKMKEVEKYGSKCALSHGQHLADALDKIRNSLRSEQKIFAGLHDVLVLKVLTPAQAAIMFILDNEGWIVEPLQVTNLLALNRGLIEEPDHDDEHLYHPKREEMARQEHSDGNHSSMLSHGVSDSRDQVGVSAGTLQFGIL